MGLPRAKTRAQGRIPLRHLSISLPPVDMTRKGESGARPARHAGRSAGKRKTWMAGTGPLLSSSAGVHGVQGFGAAGLSAHRSGRGWDFARPRRPPSLGCRPGSPVVTARRHARTCSGHPRLAASRCEMGRGRGGGPTWIPGTSPGMTARGQRSSRRRRQCCPRRGARSEDKPDSGGTSPALTMGVSGRHSAPPPTPAHFPFVPAHRFAP